MFPPALNFAALFIQILHFFFNSFLWQIYISIAWFHTVKD